MASKVQLVLEKVAREPTFAQLIIKDPHVALRSYSLTTEELNQVLSVVRKLAAPPPP